MSVRVFAWARDEVHGEPDAYVREVVHTHRETHTFSYSSAASIVCVGGGARSEQSDRGNLFRKVMPLLL